MAKSPREIAERWSRNIAAAGNAIKAGVESVTVAPTAKAAAAIDRQVAGVQRAAASGKTQRALEKTTLQDWKSAMINKAIPRIATGAQAAVGDFERFQAELAPHVEAGKRMLESMPRGDDASNQARMLAWFQHMKQFQRRG
jgi:hypothetical protein